MLRGRERSALDGEHDAAEREQQHAPAPSVDAQPALAKPCAEQQDENLVDALEGAQWLKPRHKVDRQRRAREEQRNNQRDSAKRQHGTRQQPPGGTFRMRAAQRVQKGERPCQAQPLIPMPQRREPIVAAQGSLHVRRGFPRGSHLHRCSCGEREPAQHRKSQAPNQRMFCGGHRQHHHCSRGVGSHQRMDHGQKQRGRTQAAAAPASGKRVQRPSHRRQTQGRGKAARRQVWVRQQQRSSCDGQRQPAGEQRDTPHPARQAMSSTRYDHPAGIECGPDTGCIERQQHPLERKMRHARDASHEPREWREAHVRKDELGMARVEIWMEPELDACSVESAIFGEGMEAVNGQSKQGEQRDRSQSAPGIVLLRAALRQDEPISLFGAGRLLQVYARRNAGRAQVN